MYPSSFLSIPNIVHQVGAAYVTPSAFPPFPSNPVRLTASTITRHHYLWSARVFLLLLPQSPSQQLGRAALKFIRMPLLSARPVPASLSIWSEEAGLGLGPGGCAQTHVGGGGLGGHQCFIWDSDRIQSHCHNINMPSCCLCLTSSLMFRTRRGSLLPFCSFWSNMNPLFTSFFFIPVSSWGASHGYLSKKTLSISGKQHI